MTTKLLKIETKWRNGSRAGCVAILGNGERVSFAGRSFHDVVAVYARLGFDVSSAVA